ncbi:hypothetical protein [Microcystis sp. LE19-195.1E]|uniref:hypothetical protein n=1 Tax=Microcystis sp. LE19-195.1E TaxID=3016440 RepID=UPI002589F0F1|nr:hypothetical protein [Microcystis sp. LE19-195.1E]
MLIFVQHGVRSQESGVRSQYSGDRRLFLCILPTPHTPHPTPHTPPPHFPTLDNSPSPPR